jgi:hypothetical protein
MEPDPRPDYKLTRLVPLVPETAINRLRQEAVKTEQLRPVAAAFAKNIERVNDLSILPAMADYFGYGSGGAEGKGFGWPPRGKGGDPEGVNEALRNSMKRVQNWSHITQGMAAAGTPTIDFQGWLASLLTGTWTAFEAMAGDLWVATLNAHPESLARLSGKPEKRISEMAGAKVEKSKGGSEEGEEDGEKVLSLNRIHDVTRGDYNLSSRMGEVLKGRYNFSRLSVIRQAYSQAFDPKKVARGVVDSIDAALADKALDALSAVRNMIVHRGSVADAEYVEKSKRLPTAPKLALKEQLKLDGEVVKSLIEPVVACSLNLIGTIDEWLHAEKALKAEDALSSDLREHQRPSPQITLTVPPEVEVKTGKKASFRVTVARQNVEGGVFVRTDCVPPGVTIHDLTIPADRSEGEANITADDQAIIGDYPVEVWASCGSVTATHQNTTIRIVHD